MIPPDSLADRSPGSEDLALVRRIADGDPLALSTLYDRQAQTIYSHAFHLLGDVPEAEDAVEETFWRVWRKAADYDPAVPDVATWLLLICRQRATERLRTKKRSHDGLLEDTTGLASGEQHFGQGSSLERAKVSACMAAIPADQRKVLELAFFRGMAPADVAVATKQSPETTRTRLRVAIRKLRDALIEPVPPASAGSAESTP
ncbi:MAG: RNA polymerase sigma factor [Gemmatimonadaceae bacterium]